MLLFLLLFSKVSCETSPYKYFYNVSFDLVILFGNDWNSTSSCDQFFATKNDTLITLQSMNNIFYSTLTPLQRNSSVSIEKIPETRLMQKKCNINLVISNTYFVLKASNNSHNNTHLLNNFYLNSSALLYYYFTDSKISLSFNHKSIIVSEIIDINIKEVCQDQKVQYFVVVSVCCVILMIICIFNIYCCRYFWINIYQYHNNNKEELIINNSLVLIIGISKFDDNKDLAGVPRSVEHLVNLWKLSYNYDVFICNKNTLHCTKRDIIDFMDIYLEKLESEDYQCTIIHVLSHSSEKDSFCTSDGQQMQIDYIIHELSQIDWAVNKSLVKIIFNHCCRGSSRYRWWSNPNRDNFAAAQSDYKQNYESLMWLVESTHDHDFEFEPILEDTNLIIVYGNIKGRSVSDGGHFSECIYDAFSGNCDRMNMFKLDFWNLFTELNRRLQARTTGAQICSIESTLCYGQMRLERCNVNKPVHVPIATENSHLDSSKQELRMLM